MANPFVAEIRIFAFNFAPRGWAFCNGQLMAISQNTALFSLLGTYYGGDGRSTFALPDLEGSVPIQQGQGPGLSPYFLGQTGGTENVTLLQSEMPSHPHALGGVASGASLTDPTNNVLGTPNYVSGTTRGAAQDYTVTAPTTAMGFQALSFVGGGLPHNNMMPYLTLNFCIALQGVFPPRG